MNNPINLLTIDNFLTESECNYLISQKQDKTNKSTVVCNITHVGITSDVRTSNGCFFKKHENELIKTISHRLAWLTRTQSNQQEGFQFLHYQKTEQYKPHHDYFNKKNTDTLSRGGNRIKTAIIYLNTPSLGGETYFPHLNRLQKAITGTLVVWDNLDHLLNPLIESLHAGMPIIDGHKYCLPIWIREKEFK